MDPVDSDLVQASVVYVGTIMMFGGLTFFMDDNPIFMFLLGGVQIFAPALFAFYTGLWPFYFISIIYVLGLLAALLDKRVNEDEE